MIGAKTSQKSVSVNDLRAIGALKLFAPEHLEQLASLMIRQTYNAGEFLFLEGETSIGLWFVAAGQVKISKHSMNGRILGLCLMKTGTCFGSCPLFSDEVNPATAQAIDDVTLLILPNEHLRGHKKRNPQLTNVLLRVYSQRLAHLARLSEGLANWTVGDRINDLLITYAERGSNPPVVEMTHEKLADLAGTVREVVTRHLSHLEQEEIVSLEPGRILVINQSALQPPCAGQLPEF